MAAFSPHPLRNKASPISACSASGQRLVDYSYYNPTSALCTQRKRDPITKPLVFAVRTVSPFALPSTPSLIDGGLYSARTTNDF